MRHRQLHRLLSLISLLLILLCTGLLLSACDGPDTPSETTAAPTVAVTPAPTEPQTPAPTEPATEPETEPATEPATEPETTAPGWTPDMGIFNEGKVDYVKGEDGKVTATAREGYTLGLDITDRQDVIGICYSVWFDYILGPGTQPVTDWHNITEVLEGKQQWGPSPAFHYWAKPAQGYYRSTDKTAIRNNMTMLYTAGVDFIILDHTNLHDGYLNDKSLYARMIHDPMEALFDTILEMRAEGKGTPYVVVWCGDNNGPLYRDMYDNYYNVERWRDCFVYWDGLPLLLTTHTRPESFPLKSENLFTVRSMWGLGVDFGGGQWSYLNPNIYGCYTNGKDGTPEHMGITTAAQRNYMAEGTPDKMSSNGAVGRHRGRTWYIQWYYAFMVRPKVLTLTWWNEWCAQRLTIGNNYYAFTDNYNIDYSRDIEPMEGGHGDQYYQWLIRYISAYKGHGECPLLVEPGEEQRAISRRDNALHLNE